METKYNINLDDRNFLKQLQEEVGKRTGDPLMNQGNDGEETYKRFDRTLETLIYYMDEETENRKGK